MSPSAWITVQVRSMGLGDFPKWNASYTTGNGPSRFFAEERSTAGLTRPVSLTCCGTVWSPVGGALEPMVPPGALPVAPAAEGAGPCAATDAKTGCPPPYPAGSVPCTVMLFPSTFTPGSTPGPNAT